MSTSAATASRRVPCSRLPPPTRPPPCVPWSTSPPSPLHRAAAPLSSSSSGFTSTTLPRFLAPPPPFMAPPPPPPPFLASTQAAPIAAITRLPTVTISDDVICVLCSNPLPRRGIGLPCGHLYHFSCIVPWLLRRNACPVQDCHCRLKVPPSAAADTAAIHQLPLPPPPPPETSSAFDSWHYFFGPYAEGAPPRRDGQQMPRRRPPGPSIDEPPLDPHPPVARRGGPQAAATHASIAAALATVTVGSDDAAAVCAVCTDTLPPAASASRLPCGHLYHSDCVVPWLLLRNSCPVCRRSIPTCPSTAPSQSLDPQPATGRSRRRSLPGARRIRRICNRLLTYMEASRARQPST